MTESLGDRMKNNYEKIFNFKIPRRTNLIIRLDGRSFSKYTKNLNKPFDMDFASDMQETAKYVCENIQGCKLGYVQSDEISLWITDYDKLETEAWFDNELQKQVSISASLATSKFNHLRLFTDIKNKGFYDDDYDIIKNQKLVEFDSRVFIIPEIEEVINYFYWRQQDCTRNSISMATRSVYSHKELNNKNSDEKQEMLFQKGINWNDYPASCKRGSIIVKKEIKNNDIIRNKWIIEDSPFFNKDRNFIKKLVPCQL